MNQEMEVWKDAVGYETYFQVSNLGNVYSKRTKRLIALTKLKSGYLVVNTRFDGRDGKAVSIRVHRMVAFAFLSPPSEELLKSAEKNKHGKVLVNHLDGDKTNNNVSNLEWTDNRRNILHAIETGLFDPSSKPSGLASPFFKLSLEQVLYIKDNFIPRHKIFGARALGRKFNINHMAVIRAYEMKI